MTHNPATNEIDYQREWKHACDQIAFLDGECERILKERDAQCNSRRVWRLSAGIGWALFVVTIVLVVAQSLIAADPLNDALRDAARHSVEYHGEPLYISLYDIPADKRVAVKDAIAFAAHHMSHSGVPVRPVLVSDLCVMLPAEQYDPHGIGWGQAFRKIVDPRYSPIAYSYAFKGETLVVESVAIQGDTCSFICRGKSYKNLSAKHLVAPTHREYPSWLDAGAAKLLYEQTGYDMVTASEFVAQACVGALYYEFTGAPKTLAEFLGLKSHTAFGLAGARGANLNESVVTGTQRGTETFGDYHLSFDVDKTILLTPERDVFGFPDRTSKADAYEAIRIDAGGQFKTFIANGKGERIDNGIVPGQIALDYSHGNRVIFNWLGCASCHFEKAGNTEQGGYIEHVHSNGIPASKDKVTAANLGSYFGDQQRRQREGLRDREDWIEASKLACDGAAPSECVAMLNWLFDQVTTAPVTPTRACNELCLDIEVGAAEKLREKNAKYLGDDAAATLTRWLTGVSNDALGELSHGDAINPQRFRQALPLALAHLSYARRFAK
jgi:hypothetical protein